MGADTQSFRDAISFASQRGCDVLIPQSPSGLPYAVTGVTSAEGVTWSFLGGTVIPTNVTINGAIEGPCKPLFVEIQESSAEDSTLRIRRADKEDEISIYQCEMRPHWFVGAGKIEAEWGHRANLCFQIGAEHTRCQFTSGYFGMSETILVDRDYYGSHLILSGQGFQATHLQSFGEVEIALVDMFNAGESQMKDIKVNEEFTRTRCICVSLGGTTNKITNCWFGNARYGIYQHAGTGALVENCHVEACVYNRFIGNNHDPGVSGYTRVGNSVVDLIETCNMYHNGSRAGLRIEAQPGNTIRGIQMTLMRIKNISDSPLANGMEIVSDSPARIDGLSIASSYFGIEAAQPLLIENANLQAVGCTILGSGTGSAFRVIGASKVNSQNNTIGGVTGLPVATFNADPQSLVNESQTIHTS